MSAFPRRIARALIGLLIGVSAAGGPPGAPEAAAQGAMSFAAKAPASEREAGMTALRRLRDLAPPLFDALADQAAYCFGREDTKHAVFRGCVDWHSATHAAWALMAHARATGSQRHLPLLRRRMTEEGLAIEARFLHARPRFERPYGRAWFLRLALERRALERAGIAAPPRLTAMADEVARGLLGYFQELRRDGGLDPRRGSYDSQSWALFNLLAYVRARSEDAGAGAAWAPEAAAAVVAMAREGFVEAKLDCPERLDRRGFMAICANWAALAVSVQPRRAAAAWADRFFALNPIPAPVAEPADAHQYGINFSRAWAYWTLWEATGESRFAKAYVAHIVASAPRENWAGRYVVNGHWVAQFGMFALQPLFSPRAEAASAR